MSRPSGYLSACRSAPHRAVAGLLAPALGDAPAVGLTADLTASAPERLVEIATFNHVHTALSAAFEAVPELAAAVPRDLVIYFAEMYEANRRRHAAFRDQLGTIGAAFAAQGVAAVALKGGAEVLAPLFADPGQRFVSDLDVLVAERDHEGALEALRGLGGEMAEADEINMRGHHHMPPIALPGHPALVEIHRRMGPGGVDALLPARAVLERARETGMPGILVPDDEDRLVHLVAHAMLMGGTLRRPALSLRECLGLESLRRALPPESWAAARDRFEAAGQVPAFDALDAVTMMIFRPGAAPVSVEGGVWAERAFRTFGRPGRRRLADAVSWGGWYLWQFLSNPERRRHYAAKLISREGLARWRAFHADRNRRIR